MVQKIFTGLSMFYSSTEDFPNVIRIRVRMRDLVEQGALRHAVDTTMKRYPYFCVELKKKDGQYVLEDNPRPVVITPSLQGVDLNTEEANFHLIAFAWQDNWIIMDVFHGITDGTGAYEVIRTFLYYYCSERYQVTLKEEGIRLVGDEIPMEEWVDPIPGMVLPEPRREEMQGALCLWDHLGSEADHNHTVYSVAIAESEFMRFNLDNDGSPGTMVSLLLSRAIAKLFPESEEVIRIVYCINERKALHVPLAHQSLVGGSMLEYKPQMRDWPLEKQATVYRGMVFAQTQEEEVLVKASNSRGMEGMFLSMESDAQRLAVSEAIGSTRDRIITASVSYVGKADYKEAERYIRDFRLWTSPCGKSAPTIEISAVNGRFTLEFLQSFSTPIIVNAFLKELEENDITYDLQEVAKLTLPKAKFPWQGPAPSAS